MTAPGWSTRQLSEFLEAVSGVRDVEAARRAAVDRAAQALEADLAAVVDDRRILASNGYDSETLSAAALQAVRDGRSQAIEIPGTGRCMAMSIAVGGEADNSLIVARSGEEAFTSEELTVASGLAHALSMAQRMLAGRDEQQLLREHGAQQVLERELAESHYRSLVEQLPAIVYSAEIGEAGRWTYVSPQIEEILGFSAEEWMDDPELWMRQLHPDDRERALEQENERVLGDRDPPPIDYRLLDRDGNEIWILDEAVLERDMQGTPLWHGVLYDITDRKRVESEVERRAAQQAAIARLGERALKGTELGSLMDDIAEVLASIDRIAGSGVWELDPASRTLELRSQSGLGEAALKVPLAVSTGSPAGLAHASGAPVTVDDWGADERFSLPEHLLALEVRSTVAVPIEGESQSLGVIEVHSRHPRAFSSEDADFARSAANVLALAIERHAAGEAVLYGSLHDHVTDLPNRPLFVERLEQALKGSRNRQRPLAVFFADIDYFKRINDSLGHEKGDDVLKAVVPRLRKQLRSVDTLARFSGDEFAILVEEVVDDAEAIRIAERICEGFGEPFSVENIEQHLTLSVGIAISSSPDADAESLIRDAHVAMYRAKERGRNRAELFDQEMRQRAVRRLTLERELRRALDNEELSLAFQPIVALTTGEIPALEALLRWNHPTRGPVDPSEFIPVAEESGLIHPIGRWVVERACQQSMAWHALRPDSRPIDMTVNLSARQFAQRDLPRVIEAILARTGVEPVHLKVEITESVLVEESGAADEMLEELSSLGLQLILDDFGTGYSSLAYLNRFPFDAIKIDRSFIEGLGIEQERSAIVEAIIGMARALDLKTIAEGVENEVQLAELRRLGCGFAQGFLFSGPLAVRDMTALLEKAALGTPFSRVGRPPSRGSFREEAPR